MTLLAPRRIAALFLLAVIVVTGFAEIGAYVGGWVIEQTSLDRRIRRHYEREAMAHGCHAQQSHSTACRMACCAGECSGGATCRCGKEAPESEGIFLRAPGCHDARGKGIAPPPSSLAFRFLVAGCADAPANSTRVAEPSVHHRGRSPIERRDAPPSPPPELRAA